MPLYDFECPHGHRFDRQCLIAEREEEVPCEGRVAQIATDDDVTVPCQLKAKIVMGKHNNPGGALHHGLGSNRDAAREGRYDPLNPNRRFMAKGRGYRK